MHSFFSLADMKRINQDEFRWILFEERKEKLVELTYNASFILENSPEISAMRFEKKIKIIFLCLMKRGHMLFIRQNRI